MPDSPFLSAEQREELLKRHVQYCGCVGCAKELHIHAAEADRLIAELREEQERLTSVGHEWAVIALQRNVDINELQRQLAAKKAQFLDAIARCQNYAIELGEAQGQLKRLREQLAAKDAEIADLRSR